MTANRTVGRRRIVQTGCRLKPYVSSMSEGDAKCRAILKAEKAVISTIDPDQTFLKLVGEPNLDEELALKIKDWKWDEYSLLSVYLCLGERPDFTAAQSNPDVNDAFVQVLGYENPDDLINHWKAIRQGKLIAEGFNACFPSIHDPQMAPEGKATGLISQMAPYDIEGGERKYISYGFREQLARERIEVLQSYAPNLKDNVIWAEVATPVDIAYKNLAMVKGSLKHGAYSALQMGYNRPNELCATCRTPVQNLYLGGASVYPGGFVTFGPGYLAANAVAEDFGVAKSWSEPEIVTRAKDKGLL